MYASYMKDPDTPEAAKKAKPEVVLRLLEQKAVDRYDTIPTNTTVTWTFPASSLLALPSVRMRFTNQYEMRQDVRGVFRLGGLEGVVSNVTQAVLTVPLVASGTAGAGAEDAKLSFRNDGTSSLMFRPRKDLNLLVPADAFGWNLVRAWVEMVSVLALIVSFGMFLSASLSRPVALFVAIVLLAVCEMSTSVLEQYPDSLETDPIDRIGLALTRVAAEATHPISELSPLEALSRDECVETGDVVRMAAFDGVAVPVLLALLSAVLIPRKQEDA